jgi:hypothetical protein
MLCPLQALRTESVTGNLDMVYRHKEEDDKVFLVQSNLGYRCATYIPQIKQINNYRSQIYKTYSRETQMLHKINCCIL